MSGSSVPHERGLALVGDSNRRKIGRVETALLHGLGNHLLSAAPDLRGIVLHPSRLGKDLLVFFLCHRDNASGPVEDDEARARSPLVNGSDVVRHAYYFLSIMSSLSGRGAGSGVCPAIEIMWL